MTRRFLVCGLVLAALSGWVAAADKADHGKHDHHQLPPAPTNAGFEKMKSLVGTWVTADDKGNPTDQVQSIIKLTAGGSAIEETIFPGQPMEMVSVYTAEGNDLLLTHYCVLGNQPRMKATVKAGDEQIKFDFVGGSNLDVKKDKHMHGATLKFLDADRIQIEGVAWENGEPAKEMCGTMTLIRKK